MTTIEILDPAPATTEVAEYRATEAGLVALRERLAGTEGCTHIIALLEAMAAAAVQAFASNNYRPRGPDEPAPVRVWKVDELIDTCWSYKAEGPVMQQMKQRR